MQKRYKFAPFQFTNPLDLAKYVERQFKLVAQAVRGAVDIDLGDSGLALSVTPSDADQTTVQLTDNVTLTLVTLDQKRAMQGDIEFTQDATGGRTVTFVNLVGAIPAITSTADKRTLIRFTHVGDGWVATVLASNY